MSKVTLKSGKSIGTPPVTPKKMGWKYFLIWLTGFLSAGLIVGIVAVILSTSVSTSEVIYLFGGNPEDILQPYYQNMSLLKMITEVASQKFETLGDIYTITPMVRTLLEETINPVLDSEIHYQFTWEEISIKPFKTPVEPRMDGSIDPNEDLSTYIGRAIKEGVYLKNFITGDHPVLVDLFLYPKDGEGNYDYNHPYSLMDYINADSTFFDNIINGVKIKDLTGVTGIHLIDDEDGIGNWGLNDLKDPNKIDELPLSLFLDANSTNPLIVTLRDNWTVGSLKDENNFKNLKLSEVVEITNSSPKLLQRLAELEYTIGQLETTNLYNVLTVNDVFDTNDNSLLSALGSYTLTALQDKNTIMGMYVREIFPPEEGRDTIVDKFADKTLNELADLDINDIRIKDIFTDAQINANNILKTLVAGDEDITFGDVTNTDTIQSLKLEDILSTEQINSNSVIKALVANNATIAQVPTLINSMTIGQLLDIDTTSSSTSALLKKLAGYHTNELSTFVENVTIGDVMEDFSSYPSLNRDEVKQTKLSNLEDVIDVLKTYLKLGDVVDIDPSSPWILRQLADKDLTQLADVINTFTLGDFVEIDSNSPLVLQQLANTPLDELESTMEGLTLGQIVPIDPSSPQILQALSSVTVLDGTSLITKVNSLMLCDIYDESDLDGIFQYLWDDNNEGHILITDLPSAVNDLPLVLVLDEYIYDPDLTKAKYYDVVNNTFYLNEEDVPSGHEYITYRKVNPTWWFLFTEKDEIFSNDELYYVIKNGLSYTVGDGMDDIVTNFTNHIQEESIRELYEAGLITIDPSKEEYLNSVIIYKGESRTVGSLTMSEFLDFCLALLNPGS